MPSAVAGQMILTQRWVQYDGVSTNFLNGTGNFAAAGGTSGMTTIQAEISASGSSIAISSIAQTFAHITIQLKNYAISVGARDILFQANGDSTAGNYIYTVNLASLGTKATMGESVSLTTAGDTATSTVTVFNYQSAYPQFVLFNKNNDETAGIPQGRGGFGYYTLGPITSITVRVNGTGIINRGTIFAAGFN